MPLPIKKDSEEKDVFMDRCISDKVMKNEFKDIKQRIAVCLTQYKKKAN
jgi:hypothetical protein